MIFNFKGTFQPFKFLPDQTMMFKGRALKDLGSKSMFTNTTIYYLGQKSDKIVNCAHKKSRKYDYLAKIYQHLDLLLLVSVVHGTI